MQFHFIFSQSLRYIRLKLFFSSRIFGARFGFILAKNSLIFLSTTRRFKKVSCFIITYSTFSFITFHLFSYHLHTLFAFPGNKPFCFFLVFQINFCVICKLCCFFNFSFSKTFHMFFFFLSL